MTSPAEPGVEYADGASPTAVPQSSAESSAESSTGSAPGERNRGPRGGMSPGLSQLLALLLLAALVVGVFLSVHQRSALSKANAADADRQAAIAVARQFAFRMDNFKGTDLSAYEKGVSQLVTPAALAQFKQSFPTFEAVYQKSKAVSTGTIRLAGLQDIDVDSATVLVIHDRLVTSTLGNQKQYLRWEVSLSKVNGHWLVDKFTGD